jgi:hypothetical protein
MHANVRIDFALADYFRIKQFAMGQRFVRAKVVSALARRGLPAHDIEEVVGDWQAQGLIRQHRDETISLTPAAYPKLVS